MQKNWHRHWKRLSAGPPINTARVTGFVELVALRDPWRCGRRGTARADANVAVQLELMRTRRVTKVRVLTTRCVITNKDKLIYTHTISIACGLPDALAKQLALLLLKQRPLLVLVASTSSASCLIVCVCECVYLRIYSQIERGKYSTFCSTRWQIYWPFRYHSVWHLEQPMQPKSLPLCEWIQTKTSSKFLRAN